MIRRSVFIACIFILTVAVLEVAVRFYIWKTKIIEPLTCRQEDEILHHSLKPNTVCQWKTPEWNVSFSVNSGGFRGGEIDKNRRTDLILGDSFIEGQGVENQDTVPALLEKKLVKQTDNIQVVNAGIVSYSPLLSYYLLKNKGLYLKPKMVIHFIDQNDFYDERIYREELQNASITAEPRWNRILFREQINQDQSLGLPIPNSWKSFLHNYFKSYDFVTKSIKQIFRKIKGNEAPVLVEIGNYDNDRLIVTRPGFEESIYRLGSDLIQSVELIKNLLEENGIEYYAVIYPYGHQVNAREWSKGKVKQGFQLNEVVPTTALDYLEQEMTKKGIRVLNLTEAFKESQQYPLFYSDEGHWTLAGNELVTKELIDRIDFGL